MNRNIGKMKKGTINSELCRRDENNSDQKQIPINDRLTSVKNQIETVDKVINEIHELQIRGRNLQAMSNKEASSDNETTVGSDLVYQCSSLNTLSHSKLDVEELVEIDRGLQYVQWMQIIEKISNKVK